jgi:hypothetical protein
MTRTALHVAIEKNAPDSLQLPSDVPVFGKWIIFRYKMLDKTVVTSPIIEGTE